MLANAETPFHPGEIALQTRAGGLKLAESLGRRGIRDHLPEQHRLFFAQLPLFLVGSVDAQGQPWASALTGPPGFLGTPDERQLTIDAQPVAGDPLAATLRDGAALGGLGIEFHTRRRNRVNGTARLDRPGGFTLQVAESFGNCPKYIQARRPATLVLRPAPPSVRRSDRLDEAMRAMIAAADTFFIATRFPGGDGRAASVDVSHRGGPPGFLALDGDWLTFPDYRGNFLFNTLGNLAIEPRCGLLLIDFAGGTTLQLAGRAELLWDGPADPAAPFLTERRLRFRPEQAILIANGMPLAWDDLGQAPQFAAP